MARCEDFPCCGHYDEDNKYDSWCPDDDGRFPCAGCKTLLEKGATSSLCRRCLINPDDVDYDAYVDQYEEDM